MCQCRWHPIYLWRWQQSRCPLQTCSHHRWYLCQSLDVRDFRVQAVSDTSGSFENKTCHLSSWEMCLTRDDARIQSSWINSLVNGYFSALKFWHTQHCCCVAACCCSISRRYWNNFSTILLYYTVNGKGGRQSILVSAVEMLHFFMVKINMSKVLITLVAFISISWVKQCVCRRNESCSVNAWTVSMAVLLPPSGARRN